MRFRVGLITVTTVLAMSSATVAAAQTRTFDIPAQPLSEALVAFSAQADVSIGSEAARHCGRSPGVRGRLGVQDALRRLLAGTGCGFRLLDRRTILIVQLPLNAPAQPRPTPRRPAAPGPRPAEPTEVEALVVTSPKRTVGLSRAPYALSSVEGEALNERGSADMAAVAARVAGMTVTNLGSGRNKVFLRGMADGALTGRSQSVVGVYLDDARIIYNAPDPDLRLTDVERVEVLRGPQGSLYGAGSIGGIIQIVTNAPDMARFQGVLAAQAMVTDGGDAGHVLEATLNLPIIEDRLAVRLVGYREDTGGYIDDPGQGLTDTGDGVRQGLRASVAWSPTPAWRTRVTFLDQTIQADDSHYVEKGGGGYARSLSLREPYRNDFDGLSTVVERDLGFGRLKLSNAIHRHEVDVRYDAGLSLPLFHASAVGPATFDEANRIDALVTEVTLASRPGRLTWLSGVFASEYTQRLDGTLAAAAPARIYSESRRDHIDEYAVYGEATWRITDRLRLTAGGRYYRLGTETRSQVEAGGLAAAFEGETFDNGFAPKVLAEYDWSDQVLLYAQASEGYRAGGFNTSGRPGQAFGAPGAGGQPYRRFRADELVDYEAGARIRAGAWTARVALFHAAWSDIQTDRLLPDGLPFTANVGDGRNTGAEIELAWRRGPLTLEGDLLVNDPELARPDPGFPIPADRHLPGVSDAMANVVARYEWRWRGLEAWSELQFGVIGRSSLTFDAAIAPQMGGYVTSRLSGGVAGERWRASAFVDNLLDQSGDTFAYGNPFRLRYREAETPQRPITVGVSLSRKY